MHYKFQLGMELVLRYQWDNKNLLDTFLDKYLYFPLHNLNY